MNGKHLFIGLHFGLHENFVPIGLHGKYMAMVLHGKVHCHISSMIKKHVHWLT